MGDLQESGAVPALAPGDLFGVFSTGDEIIATSIAVLRESIERREKSCAKVAMQALRNAVKARHRWWMRLVTGKNIELVRKQVEREQHWLRRLQALVNFSSPHD